MWPMEIQSEGIMKPRPSVKYEIKTLNYCIVLQLQIDCNSCGMCLGCRKCVTKSICGICEDMLSHNGSQALNVQIFNTSKEFLQINKGCIPTL